MLPLIKELMKDEQQEVRKGGIEAAVKFIEVLGADSINGLYASIKACAEDTKWRVRLTLTQCLIDLAVRTQNSDMFAKYLEPLILNYLKDRVSAIRSAAIERLPDLCKALGSNWINSFLTKLSDIVQKDPCFHFKIAAMYSLRELCLLPGTDAYLEKGLNLIMTVSKEPVANIREVCVKVERDIGLRCEKPAVREAIKKHIGSLAEDPDLEVRITVSDVLARF